MNRWLAPGALLALLAASCGGGGGGSGPKATPPAARVLGPPRVTAGELDAKRLLGDLPGRAQRLGAGPLALVAHGEVTEGERIGAFVEIPRDVCLLAYARGSSSVEDVDVAAFSDEGNPVAVDEGPDPKPTLLICPPHPDRLYVAVHAASGDGLVALAAQLVPKDKATELGRGVGARGALGGSPKRAERWPGLDDIVRARRSALGGAWEEVRRVAIATDARAPAFAPFPIEADQCTDVVVVPDEDVALVDVELLDDSGKSLARAKDASVNHGLTVCSQLSVQASLSIRPHVGRGLVAVVTSRARGDAQRDLATPEVLWLGTPLAVDKAKAARDGALEKSGYAAALHTQAGSLLMGRRTSIAFDPPKAGCARVDVVAGAPLALFEARLVDDQGAVHASGSAAESVALFACNRAKSRVDLEVRGRPGPFSLAVRKEPWSDAWFDKRPVAAARMLARLAQGSASLLEGAAGSVRPVSLDPAKVVTLDDTAPAGKCLRVGVGVEGEGSGLDVRVFDAGTSEELDRAHGSTAAAVRACADGAAPRALKIEVRASAGKLEGVVGTRTR
jgi:hypothetical protein